MPKKHKVGLFITCLVDLFRPSVGFAAIKLLEDAGCEVFVPVSQTCCGQPAWNSGDKADTAEIAIQVIKAFEEFDYIVAPSGSCAGMLKVHYREVFANDPKWSERANNFADKCFELTSFLTDIAKVKSVKANVKANITYHDSCAGLRELKIQKQPRKLLNSMKGIKLSELQNSEACCGFGGTFAVKYSDISNAIVSEKTEHIENSKADTLVAGDMGCLMNIAGKLKRQGSTIEVRHVAEILSGMTDTPPIGGKAG
ncbi:MAG: (Fe-S)-binding protein [Nitratireductor sp.]